MAESEHGERLVRLETKIDSICHSMDDLRDKFDAYVTHERFRPTELLAFGLAAMVLTATASIIITRALAIGG